VKLHQGSNGRPTRVCDTEWARVRPIPPTSKSAVVIEYVLITSMTAMQGLALAYPSSGRTCEMYFDKRFPRAMKVAVSPVTTQCYDSTLLEGRALTVPGRSRNLFVAEADDEPVIVVGAIDADRMGPQPKLGAREPDAPSPASAKAVATEVALEKPQDL